MNASDKQKRQGDVWTWILVGLVFSAVMVALYGPFIWELMYAA
jgi:hypothetical protein